MKILQVLPELKLAGAQIMVENLTNELAKRQHTVIVVSLYSIRSPIYERLRANGIKVVLLDKKNGFDIRLIFKLRSLIKQERPDVIHTHTYALKYVLFALIGNSKLPVVHTIHNLADKETTESNRRFQKRFFKNGRVIPVAISPTTQESIIQYYGLNKENVPMVYNGIALKKIVPKSDYKLHSPIQLIHIGRLHVQKNHDLLIKSMVELKNSFPDIELHCYGSGPREDEIKTMIRNNGLDSNMILEGESNELPEIMKDTDIFVLPSNWEGMPMTVIEAMAAGMPIVATPVGGIVDMISNGKSGILCENDVESFVQAIISLIADEQIRMKYGCAARKESNRFSCETTAIEYEKLYEYKCISEEK